MLKRAVQRVVGPFFSELVKLRKRAGAKPTFFHCYRGLVSRRGISGIRANRGDWTRVFESATPQAPRVYPKPEFR